MHLDPQFEETAEAELHARPVHGTMHLSIGQEASAVGAILPLRADDYILSTHRGHGHCIAKGADPARMLAEFFGKETGYCRGRGGSMHIADIEGGNLGANGIVAGGLPIAVGVGMSIKAQKQDRVCMVFFGDGATNEGAFHEALNMASIWKLPVVFVCENNKYGDVDGYRARDGGAERRRSRRAPTRCPASPSTATICPPSRPRRARRSTVRAAAADRRSSNARRIACAAIRRAIATSIARRTRSRRGAQRDPIARLESELVAHGRFDAAELAAHRAGGAGARSSAALEFAKSSPDPDPAQLTRDVYAA